MRSLERSSPSSADACGRTAALRDLRRNDPRHLSKSFMDCGRTASPGGRLRRAAPSERGSSVRPSPDFRILET